MAQVESAKGQCSLLLCALLLLCCAAPADASHLAPFSYVDRGTNALLVFAFLCVWITWSKHGWRSLDFMKKENRTMRTAVTMLIMTSLVCMIVYDAINIDIKYTEGYLIKRYGDHARQENDDGESVVVFVKPATKNYWSKTHKHMIPYLGVIFNLACTFKSSAHFLSLAFWHGMASAELGTPFGSSIELKTYAMYSVLSIAIYPALQFSYPANSVNYIVVPQLFYSAEGYLIVILTTWVNYRMGKFVKAHKSLGPAALKRITYWTRLNWAVALFVLMEAVGLSSIDIAVVRERKQKPVTVDILTHLFDVGYPLALTSLVLIFYPVLDTLDETEATTATPAAASSKVVLYADPQPSFAYSNTVI